MCSSFFFFCSGSFDGGGGTPTGPSNIPVISNLEFSPQTATVGQGGGAITITGRINFVDVGGNITTVLVSSNNLILSTTIQNISGQQSGVITFTVIISTATAGVYSIQVWVVDNQGSESNKLSRTFVVQ